MRLVLTLAFDSKSVLFQIITEWYYVLALLLLMAVIPAVLFINPCPSISLDSLLNDLAVWW